MSSTALKTLAVIMVIVAIILGFIAYQFSQGLTEPAQIAGHQHQPTKKSQQNQVMAVVAVKRIPAYEPISKKAVELVPISVEPPQYYTDVDAVIGRTPLRAVPVGAPVTIHAFGSAHTLAQAIPPGTQAMSLEISDVIAVGGFIKPGDMVDVLLYLRASGRAVKKSQARVLLKDVRVLAFEEHLINAAPGDDEQSDQRQYERTVVLAVPKDKTTRVTLGASVGELRLALRPVNHGNLAKAMATVEKRKGHARAATGEQSMPPALAPRATTVSMHNNQNAKSESGKSTKKGTEKEKTKKENQKVITLQELSEIKKEQQEDQDEDTTVQRPPGTVIEVFRGGQSTRIRRPY